MEAATILTRAEVERHPLEIEMPSIVYFWPTVEGTFREFFRIEPQVGEPLALKLKYDEIAR